MRAEADQQMFSYKWSLGTRKVIHYSLLVSYFHDWEVCVFPIQYQYEAVSNAGGEKGCAVVYLCGGGLLTSWLTCWFVDIVLAINNGQAAPPPLLTTLLGCSLGTHWSYTKRKSQIYWIVFCFFNIRFKEACIMSNGSRNGNDLMKMSKNRICSWCLPVQWLVWRAQHWKPAVWWQSIARMSVPI